MFGISASTVVSLGALYGFYKADEKQQIDQKPSIIDKIGYVPIVNSFVGAYRIEYGTIKSVISAIAYLGTLTGYINADKTRIKHHFKNGLLHVGRGFVEAFPILGGLATFWYDVNKTPQFIKT